MLMRTLLARLPAAAALMVVAIGGPALGASAPAPSISSLHEALSAPDTNPSRSALPRLSLEGGRNEGQGSASGSNYGDLFPLAKAALAPYDSLTEGGSFLSAAIQLATNLRFHVAASSLSSEQRAQQTPLANDRAAIVGGFMPRQTNAGEAGLTWSFSPWGAVSLSAGQAEEHAGLIGGAALATARDSSIGLAAHLGLGDGWVTTFAYRQGSTQLDLKPSFAAALQDERSYGLTLAKKGLFSNHDAVGLAVVRPGNIYTGGIDMSSPLGVDLSRSLIDRQGLLLGGKAETDLELGYVTTFFDGALALQANAGYQMNVAGQNGTNAVTVLSRAKINF